MKYVYKKMLSKKGDAVLRGITLFFNRNCIMFAYGWGLKRGEWWYENGDPSTARFFWWSNRKLEDQSTQLGLYIGRLGLCVMYGPKQ